MGFKNLFIVGLLSSATAFIGIAPSFERSNLPSINVISKNNAYTPLSDFSEFVDYINLSSIPFTSSSIARDLGTPSARFARLTFTASLTLEQVVNLGFASRVAPASSSYTSPRFVYTNFLSTPYIPIGLSGLFSLQLLEMHILDVPSDVSRDVFMCGFTPSGQRRNIDGFPYMISGGNSFSSETLPHLESGSLDWSANSWFGFNGSFAPLTTFHISMSAVVANDFPVLNNYLPYLSSYWFGTSEYMFNYLQNTFYESSMDSAYNFGLSDGFIEGKEVGLIEGFDNGKQVGFLEGKEVGYAFGVEQTELSYNLMGSTIYTVIGSIASFLVTLSTFEVMGVSLASIVSLILGIGLTIIVLRVVSK